MFVEAVILLFSLLVIYHIINRLREPKRLPPGPPPLPLIGNILNIVGFLPNLHLAFYSLAKKYGDIFTLYVKGQRMVVVNSASIAREALITKKDDFAGRPYTLTGDVYSRGGKGIGFADFSKSLVLQRKLVHSAIRMYNPNLEQKIILEADELLKRFNKQRSDAFDPRSDISLAILNIICAIVFGERYESNDPEFLEIVENHNIAARIVGGILDLFPWLYHLPIQPSKAFRQFIDSRDKLLTKKYHEHLRTFTEDQTRDLTDGLIHAKNDEEKEDSTTRHLITEDHVIITMQDVFIAGYETSSTTLLWLIVQLVRNPETQEKVHVELDDVIGRQRQPELKDRVALPYLEACIAETLRSITIAPLLVPRKALCDSTLQGYSIPKDTTLVINAWAIHHDEREWASPHEFKPSRYINSAGKYDTAGASYLPFGAGRRVCIGESIAKRVLFLMASRILHQFEFTAPKNSPGPSLEGYTSIVIAPKPFEICVRNRLQP